jgi:hypothetical protein
MHLKKRSKKLPLIFLLLLILGVGFHHVQGMENLTIQQKLDDFRYMYNILKDNYPFFEVKKRVYNIEWLAKRNEYEAKIINTKKDIEFEQVLQEILGELHSLHTCLYNNYDYNKALTVFSQISGQNPWIAILKKPEVIERYKVLSNQEQADKKEEKTNNFIKDKPRLKLAVIEPGTIAYLRFDSFDSLKTKTDKEPIYQFLKTIKDYSLLIIDIRGNGGGDRQYWQNNIVAPLIDKDLEAEYYGFLRGGSYFEPFLKARNIKLKDVKDLDPTITKDFPPEVVKDFKYYYKIIHAVSPSNPIGFKGDIYLLIDNGSYSAADAFAAFCKSTKFATLVGDRTMGDGIGNPIGLDMPFLALPNSGYVIRFSTGLGLNPDGSANEEKCTEPDIPVSAPIGETYEKDMVILKVIKLHKHILLH